MEQQQCEEVTHEVPRLELESVVGFNGNYNFIILTLSQCDSFRFDVFGHNNRGCWTFWCVPR